MSKLHNIWKTGVHSYEMITGLTNAKTNNNIGTTFQLKFSGKTFFRPYAKFYTENDISLRDNVHGFLKSLTYNERLEWIDENIIEKEIYLSDYNDLDIKFESLGGIFLNLSEENQQILNSKEWISIQTVYNMFPRKPGSSAKRHSLIFRGSIWGVTTIEKNIETPDIYYDLLTCEYFEEISNDYKRVTVLEINNIKIGICDFESSKCNDYINEFFNNQNNNIISDVVKIKNTISWFTPGILKSLLQKCIRVNAENVNLNNNENDIVSNSLLLVVTFLTLFQHQGSFVPDLRAFVKGAESVFKRLAVSIVEDSYIEQNKIQSLLFAALLAKQDYIFSYEYIELCCEWCLESLNNSYFKYSTKYIDKELSCIEDEVLYESIKLLGSFESDLNMFKSICLNNYEFNTSKNNCEIIDIVHCLDHHCTTDIMLFFDFDEKIEPIELPKIIWEYSSKYNSRKHEEFNSGITNEIRLTQLRYWKCKTNIPKNIESDYTDINMYNKFIDSSWISGMIGPIDIKKGYISFFHPNNISSIVTIRSISRSKDEKELTDEEIIMCEELVRNKMKNPFKLKELSIGINDEFIFENDQFYINTKNKSWNEYCLEQIGIKELDINISDNFNDNIDFITSKTSDYVIKEWKQILIKYLDNIDINIIYRITMYLRIVSDNISIYKISRDGTGTYQTVNWTDLFVFKFLCYCCELIPIALRLKQDKSLSITFEITNIFIWNNLKHLVFDYLDNQKISNNWINEIKETYNVLEIEYSNDWKLLDLDKRILQKHQQDAVDEIINKGKRGNIIWSPVGSGKTFIIINILFLLIQHYNLPKYVVYALPPGAYESVLDEFKKNDKKYPVLPCFYLDTTIVGKRQNKDKLKEYHINFIKHDHLKNISEILINNASDIFLILDEFHLMMNIETKRTSIALELSKICNNFIAMTGTLIKNKDYKGIIEWVSQVVDFKLEEKNYMVGVAALISNKINYGIIEERHFIDVEINPEDKYYSYVDSSLGGNAKTTNFRSAVKRCYEICENEIFELALDVLDNEPNVFIVALNNDMQQRLKTKFENNNIKTFCITNKNSIVMNPGTHLDIKIVITTIQHSAGYTLTAIKTMIQGVYFSNQATRTQLIGRIVRMGQPSEYVDIITVHCGILSYTLKHYEETRSLERALSDLAKEII